MDSGETQIFTIDLLVCNDSDACVTECPVEAIYPDDEVPLEWEHHN